MVGRLRVTDTDFFVFCVFIFLLGRQEEPTTKASGIFLFDLLLLIYYYSSCVV